jgi:hypothetical protein
MFIYTSDCVQSTSNAFQNRICGFCCEDIFEMYGACWHCEILSHRSGNPMFNLCSSGPRLLSVETKTKA